MAFQTTKEYEMWDCPFCGANTISILHFPKSVMVKRARTASLLGSKGYYTTPDTFIIRSGCTKCGKTADEVERSLKAEGLL